MRYGCLAKHIVKTCPSGSNALPHTPALCQLPTAIRVVHSEPWSVACVYNVDAFASDPVVD